MQHKATNVPVRNQYGFKQLSLHTVVTAGTETNIVANATRGAGCHPASGHLLLSVAGAAHLGRLITQVAAGKVEEFLVPFEYLGNLGTGES